MDHLLVYAVAELLLSFHISVSNFVVLYVYSRKKYVRTVTNSYIFSLALTDFLAGCLGIPITVISVMTRRPHSFYGCLFVHLILCILCTISTFHMLAIAIDKYVTICCRDQLFRSRYSCCCQHHEHSSKSATRIHADLSHLLGGLTSTYCQSIMGHQSLGEAYRDQTTSHHNYRRTRAVFLIAVSWVAGATISTLPLFNAFGFAETKSSFHATRDQCYFTKVVDYRYLVYVIFVGTILAPTVLIVFCYVSIYSRIRKEELQIKCLLRKSEQDRRMQGRRRLIRILLILVVSYGICWYPLYIINSIDYFLPKFSIAGLTLWAVVLSHVSCALNPLIYAYGMPGFKKALREFFNISTDQNNTGVNYSCYMRSIEQTKSIYNLSERMRRCPSETMRKVSAPTPIIKRSVKERRSRRLTIDVT